MHLQLKRYQYEKLYIDGCVLRSLHARFAPQVEAVELAMQSSLKIKRYPPLPYFVHNLIFSCGFTVCTAPIMYGTMNNDNKE